MPNKKPRHIETISVQDGYIPDSDNLAMAVPIYQTTSYLYNDIQHASDLFSLAKPGNIYTRLTNPTTSVLEKRLAEIHSAPAALCLSSGMAAIFYAVMTIAGAGHNIVSGANLYGGTHTLFSHTLKRFGLETRFVDSSNPANFAAAIDSNTRLLYTETIGNPQNNLDDLAGIASVAHSRGLPLVLDNTVAPPPIFQPDMADVIVYSLTKIIGGHGNSLGGAVIDPGRFNWNNGRFPDLAGPDPSYHGLNLWQALCPDGPDRQNGFFAAKIRTGLLRDTGAAISPMNSFLLLQGLETLTIRAEKVCQSAAVVAKYLAQHPCVTWVNYAGLPSHKDHSRTGLFPLGPGAVFGFGVRGGYNSAKQVIEAVRLCRHLANILDARTLIIHPASTTHSQLSPEELAQANVPNDMIRLSIGLEHPDDITADLDQALRAACPQG